MKKRVELEKIIKPQPMKEQVKDKLVNDIKKVCGKTKGEGDRNKT